MVLEALGEFMGKNFTLSVIASLVIFNVLTVFVQGIITPAFMTYADPDHNLQKLNITTNGKYVIKFGTFIKEFIIAMLILLVLSQIDKLTS